MFRLLMFLSVMLAFDFFMCFVSLDLQAYLEWDDLGFFFSFYVFNSTCLELLLLAP